MRIACSVDRLDDEAIEGWIADRDDFSRPLAVDILLDGPEGERMIGLCAADRFRADLREAGLGDGSCAFRFDMPPLPPGQLEQIRLRLHGSDLFLRRPKQVGRAAREGLWIDQPGWLDHLARKHRAGAISTAQTELLFRFIRDGWVAIPNAAPEPVLRALLDEIQQHWAAPPPGLLMESFEPDGQLRHSPPDLRWRNGRASLVSLHGVSAACRAAIANPLAVEFLTHLFDSTPHVFRSRAGGLPFGSPMQKATAFFPLRPNPLALVSCFLLLEDSAQGEIEFLTGSYRAPPFLFGESRWIGEDVAKQDAYSEQIAQDAETFGHLRQPFGGGAGDLLICHAELAHGVSAAGSGALQCLVSQITSAENQPVHGVRGECAAISEHGCLFSTRVAAAEQSAYWI